MKMAREAIACIFAFKTYEHVIFPVFGYFQEASAPNFEEKQGRFQWKIMIIEVLEKIRRKTAFKTKPRSTVGELIGRVCKLADVIIAEIGERVGKSGY